MFQFLKDVWLSMPSGIFAFLKDVVLTLFCLQATCLLLPLSICRFSRTDKKAFWMANSHKGTKYSLGRNETLGTFWLQPAIFYLLGREWQFGEIFAFVSFIKHVNIFNNGTSSFFFLGIFILLAFQICGSTKCTQKQYDCDKWIKSQM